MCWTISWLPLSKYKIKLHVVEAGEYHLMQMPCGRLLLWTPNVNHCLKFLQNNKWRCLKWLPSFTTFNWLISCVGKWLPTEREINPDFHIKALWIEHFTFCWEKGSGASQCRSSPPWHAGTMQDCNTATQRISGFLLKRRMRSLGFFVRGQHRKARRA